MKANPFSKLSKKKTPQEEYQEKKKQEKETGKVERTVAIPRSQPSSGYMNKQYKGESETKKSSYQWEKDILTPLSIRQYGRSHNDKFKKWASEQGLSESEAKEFRTWLDSKEDKQKTKSSNIDDILKSTSAKSKTQLENFKKLNKTADISKANLSKKENSNGILDFLDSTLGRASRSMQSTVLGKDFVEQQDNAYRNNIMDDEDDVNKIIRLDRLENVSRLADSKLEKVSDIAGAGLGIVSYLAPGAASYKAANTLGNFAKLTSPGAKVAESLAGRRMATEAIRGASAGAIFESGVQGMRELVNPEEFSATDHLKRIGLGATIGAVADPAIVGIGKGLGKLANNTMKSVTPSDEATANVLSDALQGIERRSLSKQPLAESTYRGTIGETPPAQSTPFDAIRVEAPLARNETAAMREASEAIEALKDDGVPMLRADSAQQPLTQQPVNKNIPYKPGDPLPDTSSHIGSKTALEMPSPKSMLDKSVIAFTDNLDPLRRFSKIKSNADGEVLKASEDPYKLGLNSRGADQTVYQILNNDLVDKSGNVVGSSLKSIVSKIPKKNLKGFEDYLVNKHAITRQEKGQKVFPDEWEMNSAKSAGKVAEYEAAYPEFKELSEEIYKFQQQINENWLVNSGLLSKEQLEQYTKGSPDYIPNYRLFNEAERTGRGKASQGFNNQNSQIKKANKSGSQRRIVSPIESIIEQTENVVKASKRNETMQVIIKHINENPELFKDWAEIVPTTNKSANALKSLEEDGVEGLLTELNTSFEKQKPDLSKGNVVFGVVNGEKVHVRVHEPDFLKAITNLSPQGQSTIIKWSGEITRVMKTLTTGLNPVFSFARNIWRDIPAAYVNSKTVDNPLTFTKDYLSAIMSVITNDEWFKTYRRVGGGHASSVSQNINLLAQSKRNITGSKNLKDLGGKLIAGVENVNNLAEVPPRLAEFKRIAKKDPSYDGKVNALFEANDITTNFKRHGNLTKEADALFPYLNAAIQGLNKTGRVIKDNPVKSTMKGLVGVSVPTAILYAINYDNPDYHELSDYIKDNNYLLPTNDGKFIKIPKPRELGAMFGSSIERALNKWMLDDPEAFENWIDAIKYAFVPPISRTIYAPINDIHANKNFMDAPIVPADLRGLSPELQYDSKTSEVAKGFGALTNQSPKEIDYLIKSYSGIIGELGIPLTTKGGSVGDTLVQKVTADPVFSNDHASKFFDLKEKLDTASADYNRAGIESEHLDDDLRKEMNKQLKEISEIRKEVKAIQNDESLDNKEKREKIRDLQKKINELYRIDN